MTLSSVIPAGVSGNPASFSSPTQDKAETLDPRSWSGMTDWREASSFSSLGVQAASLHEGLV